MVAMPLFELRPHHYESEGPFLAELRSSVGKIERLLWSNSLVSEGKFLKLRILP
jgi:hypothetical protein